LAGEGPLRTWFSYSVQRQDLEAKTLRVFKLTRAALIYVSLGMHREERCRAAKRGKGLIAPMTARSV